MGILRIPSVEGYDPLAPTYTHTMGQNNQIILWLQKISIKLRFSFPLWREIKDHQPEMLDNKQIQKSLHFNKKHKEGIHLNLYTHTHIHIYNKNKYATSNCHLLEVFLSRYIIKSGNCSPWKLLQWQASQFYEKDKDTGMQWQENW